MRNGFFSNVSSNSVNGRERYFIAIILSLKLRSGRMVQWYEASLFTLEDVELQVQIVFLLGLFPFIHTADPF